MSNPACHVQHSMCCQIKRLLWAVGTPVPDIVLGTRCMFAVPATAEASLAVPCSALGVA